ncbi:DUF1672 family protein, partial [Staphylococcus aureus]
TYLSRNLKEYRKYYEPLIHKNDKQFKGQAIDLDYDGYLIVRDEAGESHRLISADIDF